MHHITDQIDQRLEQILQALTDKGYSVGELVHLTRDHGARGFDAGWSLRIQWYQPAGDYVDVIWHNNDDLGGLFDEAAAKADNMPLASDLIEGWIKKLRGAVQLGEAQSYWMQHAGMQQMLHRLQQELGDDAPGNEGEIKF